MEIRIDRLEGINKNEPDLVYFEAVVRFDNGTVRTSILCWHYQQAVSSAKKIVDYWVPLMKKFPGVYKQSPEERDELWAIPPEASASTYLDLSLFS